MNNPINNTKNHKLLILILEQYNIPYKINNNKDITAYNKTIKKINTINNTDIQDIRSMLNEDTTHKIAITKQFFMYINKSYFVDKSSLSTSIRDINTILSIDITLPYRYLIDNKLLILILNYLYLTTYTYTYTYT